GPIVRGVLDRGVPAIGELRARGGACVPASADCGTSDRRRGRAPDATPSRGPSRRIARRAQPGSPPFGPDPSPAGYNVLPLAPVAPLFFNARAAALACSLRKAA